MTAFKAQLASGLGFVPPDEMLAGIESNHLTRDRGSLEEEANGARDLFYVHAAPEQGRAAFAREFLFGLLQNSAGRGPGQSH